MKIKQNVIMPGLKLPMQTVLKEAEKLWKKHGQELVVTSALDGTHSAGSYHYYGYALDFRTRYFNKETAQEIANELQEILGRNYTVLFEGNHTHVQFNASNQEA